MSPSTVVRWTVQDGVGRLVLDNPEKRNALDDAMLDGLLEGLRAAADDDTVRVVVLASSHPKVFSAGGDLSGFTAEIPLIHKHLANARYVELMRTLSSFPKPTICAAGGHVLAGSFGIALACDLVLAADSATFGTPEIDIGAFPFMISALIFRNVPRKRAMELLLTGQRLSAAEAHQLGFVNRVVPGEELDATVDEWARNLASKSPLLVRLGKEAVRRQMDMNLDDALDHLRSQLTLAFATDDVREGVSAFFEKRDPVWSGQ